MLGKICVLVENVFAASYDKIHNLRHESFFTEQTRYSVLLILVEKVFASSYNKVHKLRHESFFTEQTRYSVLSIALILVFFLLVEL